MSAADIAKALGGHRSGDGFLVRCPAPGHGKGNGDKHPSLLVKDGDQSVLVTCFGGCDRRDVLAALRSRGLLDDQPKVAYVHNWRSRRPAIEPEPEPEPNDEALSIWRSAVLAPGTLVETYLRDHRAITIPIPASLRFANVAYARAGVALPALVAALQRPDRKIVAVQVTYLRADGRKASVSLPRMTLGAMGHGAVRVGPATDRIGIAEGVENALAAMELIGVPTWAALGAHRLHKIELPATVREVHVFADADAAGRAAAERAAEVHTRRGRRVLLRYPPIPHADWNDALVAEAEAVA